MRNPLRTLRLAYLCRRLERLSGRASLPEKLAEQLGRAWANPEWQADTLLLQVLWREVHQTSGNVLECGSGLTTLLLGAGTRRTGREVCCLEHDAAWARFLSATTRRLEYSHVRILLAPLAPFGAYDWYGCPPAEVGGPFGLVLVDGPPGSTRGGRVGLMARVGSRLASGARIVLDDAGRSGERAALDTWRTSFGLRIDRTVSGARDIALLVVP